MCDRIDSTAIEPMSKAQSVTAEKMTFMPAGIASTVPTNGSR